MSPAAFEQFAALLRARSGLVIGPDKLYLLEVRLAPILKRERLPDLPALAERLRQPGAEPLAVGVVEAMTTNESFFFRDDKPFAHFRNAALPRMLAARGGPQKLRVWSAASSSGQEAYSLAMIVAESRAAPAEVEILGTDLSREQIDRARAGLYNQFEIQRGLPMRMLVRHFRKEAAGWRVQDALRERVRFQEWNLLSDLRPLGRFDIVFCRNVLIYFDAATKRRVLEAIGRQMAPDGLLYLGGAETVLGITDRFAPLPGERGVYQQAASAAAPSTRQVAMAG